MTVGTDSTTVDLTSNQIVFQGEKGKVTKIKFSPNAEKAITCVGGSKDGACKIKTIKETKGKKDEDITLPSGISDMQWMDDNTATFVVGQSLYDYDIKNKKLEKVSTERSEYKLMAKNSKKNSMIVIKGEEVKEIRSK
jgi:hypothetical protein